MSALTGRYCCIKVGGSGSSCLVENLGRWELTFNFDEMDATVFGSVWGKSLPGMIKWSGTAEGFFDSSSGSVQHLQILDNALDATLVQDIRFYLQTSSGLFWMPQYTTWGNAGDTAAGAYLSNVRIGADKSGLASLGFNILGYGPIALFSVGSSSIIIEGT